MRGKEIGDIGMLKGGLLAWLLWQGGVVEDVVILIRINVIRRVYWRRRGGRNSKYNANISMTMHDMTMSSVRCALTW